MPVMAPGKLTPNYTENKSDKEALNPLDVRCSFPILAVMKNTLEKGEKCKLTIITTRDHKCCEVNTKTFEEELHAVQYGYDLYSIYDRYFIEKEIREFERKKEYGEYIRSRDMKKYKGYMARKEDGSLTQKELQNIIERQKGRKSHGRDGRFEFEKKKKINALIRGREPLFECEIQYIVKDFSESSETHNTLLKDIIRAVENEKDTYLYADLSFGSKPMPIVLNDVLKYMYNKGQGVIPRVMSYSLNKYDGKSKDELYDISNLMYSASILDTMQELDKDASINEFSELLD